jgi:hypothetical protein
MKGAGLLASVSLWRQEKFGETDKEMVSGGLFQGDPDPSFSTRVRQQLMLQLPHPLDTQYRDRKNPILT